MEIQVRFQFGLQYKAKFLDIYFDMLYIFCNDKKHCFICFLVYFKTWQTTLKNSTAHLCVAAHWLRNAAIEEGDNYILLQWKQRDNFRTIPFSPITVWFAKFSR
jgi:hypothetical protein